MTGHIKAYTGQVLSFRLGAEANEPAIPALPPADVGKHVRRCLRILEQSRAETLVLFGLGEGGMLNALAQAVPSTIRLIACELTPSRARQMLPGLDARWEILADTSPWAHLCLLGLENVSAANAGLMLNPELPAGPKRTALQALQRQFSQMRPHAVTREAAQRISLSAGAILSPHEPDLAAFFSQFPAWLQELCIVWDSETVPEMNFTCACPVRQAAHPLDDFASQRNRMKRLCTGEWLLYLDGDELLVPRDWEALPALIRNGESDSFYFTRQTLYPDVAHAKVGFGLWPDLQQRLFRNEAQVRFERPIHEKLAGLNGPAAIVLDLPILHYSRLRKSPQQIREKLARFDEAAAQDSLHRLSKDYPSLDRRALHPHESGNMIMTLRLPGAAS
ncbi:glycosyl transferase family 2 [Salidesulfovibrio onnuriiensis]|uniref:glycosyl transferase family 2 n=1 Tax=Salidesulfovibrio onnuriiensis TaxID=2583823 RepID=UPI0011CC7FB8|nr:glycosyl transferase family 2 [Salidesulfovibrio onnuriiensis]